MRNSGGATQALGTSTVRPNGTSRGIDAHALQRAVWMLDTALVADFADRRWSPVDADLPGEGEGAAGSVTPEQSPQPDDVPDPDETSRPDARR